MMTKKINNFVNEQTLRTTTIKNIKTVIRLTDLTHAEFAKKRVLPLLPYRAI